MFWTKDKLIQIDRMQCKEKTYLEMAEYFNVTESAIQNVICKKLGRIIFCLDCGKKVDLTGRGTGGRKRCVDCANKFNSKSGKENSKIWYANLSKEEKLEMRSQKRFGGNREKVIKRDSEKCVICGLSREEQFKKYNKDLLVCTIDISTRKRNKEKTDINKLETLCSKCQGLKRVSKRSKNYSMCGGIVGRKTEQSLKEKRTVRCQNCFKTFSIYYDPIKNYDRYRNQKCEYCEKKFSYTKKEKEIIF